MRYLLGSHRAFWSQTLRSRDPMGEHAVRSPFSALEEEDEVWTFTASTPGQRWRAFLPRVSRVSDDGFFGATTAYAAIAKRWSRSKARAERWVPIGRSKTGLRLDLGAGTSTCRRDY